MGLGHAGAGDPHELRLGAHLFDVGTAGVAHRGAQAAHQLVDDRAQGALVRHTAFDAFRNQLLGACRGVLEVTVGGTLSLGHGAQRTHAAISLVRTTLEQFDLARRFFGTGEHRAHHHAGSTGHDGLGQVTGETDAAVGDQRYASAFKGSGDVGDGTDLRHADTGDDTGGADRARADTDLDCVGASFGQGLGGSAGGDVAADDLHFREVLLDPANAVDHALGVTVSGVDHHHVNAGGDQCGNAITGVFTGTDCSTHAQTTLIVLAGQRVSLGFFDVVDGHHALEGEFVVDDQHAFDAVLVQQFTHIVLVGAFLDRDQALFRRHHFTDSGIQAVFEAYVTGSHDADQVAIVQYRNAGDVVLAGQFEQVTHRGIGLDGDRVLDHAGLELLDLAHFGSLLLDGHVLVDDADAAFLGHGNGQTGFGHGIHGGGNQRNIQLDATGQTGLETDFVR
ncbi:hypothetical protein D3C76_675330 [compost metagenome]